MGKNQIIMDAKEMIKKVKIHGGLRILKEADFYPEHEKRRSTEEYRAIHKKLVIEKDLPCLICGVKYSDLIDKEKRACLKVNPFTAKQIETHHHVIEWSLANAIDVEKFNNTLLPHLKSRHPNEKLYHSSMTRENIKNWVDHHEHNLWVLCDVHHRHKFFGIHAITGPMWSPQNLFLEDFKEAVSEQIEDAPSLVETTF